MIKEIKGIVIKGKQLGRTIGFPTANIKLNKNLVEDGTYKINILIDGKIFRGAGSANNKLGVFESYIFEFSENIYDKEIKVIVLDKIRNNKNFENIETLKNQIKEDIKKIKEKNNYILTFGSYDLVHEGHKNHLEQSRQYGNILVTILATDKNIEKFKGKKPLYPIEQRIEHIKDIGLSDIVSSGDEDNPMKWIDMYMPSVICLGYDQIGFSNELKKYITNNNLDVEIIRTKPFRENEYKSSILKNKIKYS